MSVTGQALAQFLARFRCDFPITTRCKTTVSHSVCGGGVYFHAITNNKSFFALFFSSDVDEYGFKRPENFDYKSYEQFMSNYLKTLAKRRKKWEAILEENTDLTNVNPKLKRFIRKGIPGNT